jgi:hypothetical protein
MGNEERHGMHGLVSGELNRELGSEHPDWIREKKNTAFGTKAVTRSVQAAEC